MTRLAVAALGLLLAGACTNYPPVYGPQQASTLPTSPTAPTPAPTADLVEYRVTGTVGDVVVRFATSFDGLTQVRASLPYSISFSSTRAPIFLSLEATPLTVPFATFSFLSCQIYVNGILFREASTSNPSVPLSVTGTWRRGAV